ncbi:MAG: sugar phosphate isomerase/epimerase [Chloroflexi bacterium]|nr:sugar phosphate isomerase/epimerase [Chloroflexota bacterium]
MKFGVFTVMLPDLTPEEAVQEIKASGHDGVEWRVTHIPLEQHAEAPSFWGNNLCTIAPTEAEMRRARRLAESAGLEIPNLGTYISVGDAAAVEEAMRLARIAGSPHIRVGVAKPSTGQAYAELFAATQTFLAEVVTLARRYHVKALLEIHHKTICPSVALTHRLVSHFDPDCIGVIHDAGNMVHEGFEDYRLGLELLGPYLAHVHLKNAAFTQPQGGGVWTPCWFPLEDGVVDFRRLLLALQAVSYEGWLVFEDFSQARPSREALGYNLAFVKNLLKEIGG